MRYTVKVYPLLLALLLSAGSVASATAPDIAVVRIDGLTRADVTRLTFEGIDIDGVWGNSARAYLRTEQYFDLLRRGFDITRLPSPGESAGARAGYHSHNELTADLQAIAAAYPGICTLQNAGDSVQGRELWFMKISDNVNVEEDEPEFRYISTMHGDEPIGMELCLKLIEQLTSQYGSDSQVTDLVNETEIWIMPLMNPDGYTSGSRYNANYVDLNRDFPDRVTDPVNTTAGRATETRHVMNWGFAHSPALSANFHSGALVVNYPYDSDPNSGATYSATPDDALIIQMSLTYSSLNSPMYSSWWFNNGIVNGVEWYAIYGGLEDWNYVWMGCTDVTVELSDDKWPNYSQINGLWNDNRDSMLAYMEWCLKGVRGLVTDSVTGQPIDATVRVVGIDHDVYTDPDVGDYHRMLESGTYSVRFTANGYHQQTISGISVGSGDATRVDVALVSTTAPPGTGYCFGDPGSGTPCPCSNDNDGSIPGSGCDNGAFSSGARLGGSGTASVSADTLVLTTTHLEPSNSGLYFQANNNLAPGSAWGDGLQCAGGNLKRLQVRFADGSGTSHTTIGISAKAGNVTAGATKRYQCWYRTTSNPPCGSGVNDFNASNGYEITWTP
jgi:hypothetical protein